MSHVVATLPLAFPVAGPPMSIAEAREAGRLFRVSERTSPEYATTRDADFIAETPEAALAYAALQGLRGRVEVRRITAGGLVGITVCGPLLLEAMIAPRDAIQVGVARKVQSLGGTLIDLVQSGESRDKLVAVWRRDGGGHGDYVTHVVYPDSGTPCSLNYGHYDLERAEAAEDVAERADRPGYTLPA